MNAKLMMWAITLVSIGQVWAPLTSKSESDAIRARSAQAAQNNAHKAQQIKACKERCKGQATPREINECANRCV